MDIDALNVLTTEIAGYEQACKENVEHLAEARREVSEKVEPDQSKFDERQAEINEENKRYASTFASFTDEIKDMTDKWNNLSKLEAEYKENIDHISCFPSTLNSFCGKVLSCNIKYYFLSRV